MRTSSLECFHVQFSIDGRLFPTQTHFYSYQILLEYFKEFSKTQPSWHSSSLRMPFQEWRLPTPLVIKQAVILWCCQAGIFRLCSHMWHVLQNCAYWEDFLEPAFQLRTHQVKRKLTRRIKWYIPYRSCDAGPLSHTDPILKIPQCC